METARHYLIIIEVTENADGEVVGKRSYTLDGHEHGGSTTGKSDLDLAELCGNTLTLQSIRQIEGWAVRIMERWRILDDGVELRVSRWGSAGEQKLVFHRVDEARRVMASAQH